MPSAAKTPNFNLTQYANNGSDKVSFLGDYNADMLKIDTAMKTNANNIVAKEDKTAHAADVTTINAAIALKEDSTAHAADVTTINAAIALKEDKTAHAADVTTINAAIALKEDKTAHNSDIIAVNNAIGLKRNYAFSHLVCIGDSWGRGYNGGANHDGNGWPDYLKTALNIPKLDNLSVSASGYLNNGDSYSFPDQWNHFTGDKSDVDLVVILGGQNDAWSTQNLDNLTGTAADLVNKISADCPKAEIHVFIEPLCLGEQLTRKNSGESPISTSRRIQVYRALRQTIPAINNNYGNIFIHDGAHRWGMAVLPGDADTDQAHLLASGYKKIANMAAYCIKHGTDFWPTFDAAFNNSGISGSWTTTQIVESNGIIHIIGICNYNAQLSNGQVITTLPIWALPTHSMFYNSAVEPSKYFISFDPTGLKIQAANTASSGTLDVDITFQAGMV